MDNNNFGNDFYGAEPQKPFTEKSKPDPARPNENTGSTPTFDYEPQQPLINKTDNKDNLNEQTDADVITEPQDVQAPKFGPDTQTFYGNSYTYHQGSYVQQSQNQQTGYQPNQPQNMGYNTPHQNFGYNQNYNAAFPNSYQNYNTPQQQVPNFYTQPPQYNGGYPHPVSQQTPQKSGGKGLIAVIIILSILLVASIIGILTFVLRNTSNNTSGSNNNSQFSFTIPQDGYGNTPDVTTAPQTKHNESDYTNKAIPDFKGLDLENKPKDANKNTGYTAEYAFSQASDSVVGILCYEDKIADTNNSSSQGSGIIITQDGYVITNAHVVGNSKTMYAIQVVTADGKKYNAGVVGIDSRTDIAVLKMDDAADLTPAKFGNSEYVELGEDIIVIGNPGGLDFQNSLTKGVVSAINRESSSKSLVKYIQTDAAINPGNSGGPIVNLYGQVIGIATSKIVSEKYEGMGFAIPSATAKNIVDSLMKNGYVEGRVRIGITGEAVTSEISEQYNVPQGILVDEISSDGPCANTKLKVNDIITKVDEKTVTTFSQIYEILENHKEGDKVKIKYYRYSDGTEGEFEITLQADK